MYSFVLKKRIRKRTLIKPTLTWLKVLSSQSQFSNNKQAKYHNFIFPKVSPLIMSLKLPPEVRLMQSSEISRRSLKKWWKNLPAMFLDYQIIFQRFYQSEQQEKLMLRLWRKPSSKSYGNSCKTNKSNTEPSIYSALIRKRSSA